MQPGWMIVGMELPEENRVVVIASNTLIEATLKMDYGHRSVFNGSSMPDRIEYVPERDHLKFTAEGYRAVMVIAPTYEEAFRKLFADGWSPDPKQGIGIGTGTGTHELMP